MTSDENVYTLENRVVADTGGLFVPPGHGRHLDRAMDCWELILVRSGSLHIEVAGEEYRVRPGESLLMPPFQRHRGLSDFPADLSFFWIHFTLAQQTIAVSLQLPRHIRVARPQRLTEWFHDYLADQAAGTLTSNAADALLLLMLNETTLPSMPLNSPAAGPIIRKAEEYVSQHLQRGIAPGEVANAIGYNTGYLSRLFRRVHGVTLGEYIHRAQIAHARVLLHNSTTPIKQISKQCGFQDEGYFRRLFRREVGISPRGYRNRFGRIHINRD